jgi:beta-N-acetylhexosaminidase
MTAHIVYPQLDAEHPATLSRRVLTGILRESMGYDGVVITDALMMKAVHERYGHARAAVLALQAGADMPLAQGSVAEQTAAIEAIAAAHREGRLALRDLQRAQARIDALAQRFPLHTVDYPAAQREADEALMRHAWARGLCTLRGAAAPARGQRLRVICQASVVSDGVSEAGASAEQVRALFAAFEDVELLCVPDLRQLSPAELPRDARLNVLVSNQRGRFGSAAAQAPVDLHLVLWNPFQALDVPAPAVISWGYADGALDALKRWLGGELDATVAPPVQLA